MTNNCMQSTRERGGVRQNRDKFSGYAEGRQQIPCIIIVSDGVNGKNKKIKMSQGSCKHFPGL